MAMNKKMNKILRAHDAFRNAIASAWLGFAMFIYNAIKPKVEDDE